jgi:hypothetical protein
MRAESNYSWTNGIDIAIEIFMFLSYSTSGFAGDDDNREDAYRQKSRKQCLIFYFTKHSRQLNVGLLAVTLPL